MPRPPLDRPKATGPYKHRRQWRLVIYTPRGPGDRRRRPAYRRYFDSFEAAATWQREFNRQVAASGRTVGDALNEYVDHLANRKGNKSRSIATSRYRIMQILDLEMPLADVTPRRAQELYEEMVEDGYVPRGSDTVKMYSADTHHAALMEAKALMRFCIKRSWLSRNPFDLVETIGKKRRRKKQLRVDEARTYTAQCLKTWTDNRDRSAIAALLPLAFNLRASEVANLVGRDVDDQGRLLWVAYNEDETGEDQAKTSSSRRAARVPQYLVSILRHLAANPATPDGHLFAKQDGTAADRYWVRYHVLRVAREAGTPPVTTHGLRGTHGSIGTAGGLSAEVVGRELGHDPRDQGRTAKAAYIDPAVAADAQIGRVEETLFEGVPEPVDPEATPRLEREGDPT